MANLDRQLDALDRYLQALDETEAQSELDAVEARIAADKERADRLRAVLQVKQTWAKGVPEAAPERIDAAPRQGGQKSTTREAILAFLRGADEWVGVSDIRRHLRTLDIEISSEAVRKSLRRLRAEDTVAGETINGVSYYKLTAGGDRYRELLESAQ
jgi:hypothetical protein